MPRAARTLRRVSHEDLLEAVWEAVPPGAVPERFAERRDWLLARVQPGEEVLDLGCGEGGFAAALAAHGTRVVAVEVVDEPLRRARERHPGIDFRRAPLDGPLPLADASVDVAWLGETLEHLADPVGTLQEVRRVLRPSGRLLATTPDHPPGLLERLARDPAAFAEHFSPRTDHLRFFNALSLGELVADLGFGEPDVTSDGETLFVVAGAR
jgi:SAM-dependent methyltransferase